MSFVEDKLGYLILTEDGAVLESGGELENDERVATIITDLISLSNSVDPIAFGPNEPFKKISIAYEDHWFAICLSNKKIHVVKRSIQATASEGIAVNV
ncbi:unnamed protein product [Colias eurytheme]|nr:unnamed protein product [Colias eurytheme]